MMVWQHMAARWGLMVALALPGAQAFGQALTTHPYSAYSVGLPYNPSNSRTWALGGVSLALPQYTTLSQNPALFSDLRLTTIEAGGVYGESTYDQNNQATRLRFGGLNHLNLAFPTRRNWTIGIGLDPYSSIGFQTRATGQVIEQRDTVNYSSTVLGEGGLSQLRVGVGYALLKRRLQVGATFQYVFGNSRGEFSQASSSNTFTSASTVFLQERTFSGRGFRLGVAYGDTIGKWLGRVGLVFQPKMNLNYDERLSQFPGSRPNLPDTTFDGSRPAIPQPAHYGIGFALDQADKWSFALDAEYRDYSVVRVNNQAILQAREGSTRLAQGRANWMLRTGVEHVPNIIGDNYFQRISYRVGLHYQTGALAVRDDNGTYQAIPEYGVRAGIALPLPRQYSRVHIGFGYGWRGTDAPGLIRERFPEFSIGMSFNELWFIRRAYD